MKSNYVTSIMEEEKLVRRKKKALNGSNSRALAEACNDLATFYYKHNRYDDALEEYKQESGICKELGLRLEWATCNRMIGEMYMLMAEFDKALKYEDRHLAVAKDLKNLVEEQRAMATLGRIYLLQGQSTTNDEEAKISLKAAEKAFMKSLLLCEGLSGKTTKHELMDMRARLLLNIGVVQEHLGFFDKAIDCIRKAITICSNEDLYEVLHNCHTTEASLHSNKRKDYAKALSCLNKALEVASRLEDKVLKTCETLSLKADILCKMSDYQSAKQVLLKAWKLKSPDEDEHGNIESNLKVVAAMCYTEDLLISTDPSDHLTFKKLYEKLGDGACHLKNYAGAVENYLKMLDHAELGGDCGKTLIPIYVSLYQTYKDMGCYTEALDYYEKEYELIKDVPKEAYTTLYNIAEALFLAKKPYHQIEKACLNARNAAKDWNKKKYEIRVLKNLLKYQEEYGETDKMDDTKIELGILGYDDFDKLENSEDEQSSVGGDDDTTHIGDDVCLEDLTDLSDTNDEDVLDKTRETRRRGKGFAIKKNMKGETQLHVACISGNKLLVERLLAKGHPVNVRDNAGWLPLHEACIHGRLEISNILINNGANVNDRGGSNCDGITPLYDAASNGHLDVVQLLLKKGAMPSLKTDFGETPLHALQKWRANNILSNEDELAYSNICNKIHSLIEKTGVVDLNRSKSKTPVKLIKNISPPSTSKLSSRIKDLASPIKRRNVIDDDSEEEVNISQNIRNQPAFPSDSDSSDDCKSSKNKTKATGVDEYKSAISALRNRSASELPEVDVKKNNSKPALLNPNEVDDDWLDDDLGGNNKNNKKRKLSDPLNVVAKKPSYDNIKTSIENINKLTVPLVESNKNDKQKKNRFSDFVDVSENSSDSDCFQRNENVCPRISAAESMANISKELNDSKSTDSRGSMRRRWKRQSTLLKAGFQRSKEDDISSNDGSDNEFARKDPNKRPAPSGTLSRKTSNENFNYNEGFNVVQSMNPNIMQPVNVIQPINILQSSRNGRAVQTQILPPAAVKVHIEDKVLLISLKLDTINKLTISWLVEEVKSRYYKLTGVRPVFSLMTSDGALLSEDDPLSLVLSSPELKTCITNWKASPAEERYLECCDALDIPTSEEIQQAVGRSHTTRRLALGARTLPSSQIRPLFRAMTHQTQITAVMISDNNIGDDGMKYLAECMCTMKQLTHLDVSRNNITAEGTRILLNIFDKATRPVCQSLDELDISSNPISNDGFRNIVKLCYHIKLRVLKLNNCNLTENAINDTVKSNMNFDSLESLDISNNDIKQAMVSCLMTSLNPNVLSELDLDNVGVEGAAVGCIAAFLDSAKELKIRKFSLSNCKLVDGQFMRIFRSLGRAKHLQSVSLKNNMLTFISLKKLLQRQPPVPQINLESCQDIFKYSPDSDFHVWLPAINFGRCIPEINVTPVAKSDAERESFKQFSKTWLNCFNGRGMIEHCEGGVIKFTAR